MIVEIIKTLVAWLVILPGLYLSGSLFSRWITETDARLRGILYVALGLAAFMFYLIAAGSLGQYHAPAVVFYFGIVLAVCFRRLRDFIIWFRDIASYPWQGNHVIDRILAVIFYTSVFFTAAFCLLPEIANDALCYQLNVPKQFVWQKSIWPIPYDANSFMPVSMNLLYGVGIMAASIGITKLFHAVMALLLAYAIAFKIEHLSGSSRIARLGAFLFWISPVVVNEAATTYVDLGVSFFLLVSFLLLHASIQQEKKAQAFIAGLMTGTTIAVKFSLLIALPVIGLVGFARLLKPFQFKKLSVFAALFAAGILMGCGYWFTRNFILMGNPTFPYFGEVFNTIGLKSYGTYLDIGVPKTLLNFIILPFHLAFNPWPFDQHYWTGPYLLLMIPALILSIRHKPARPFFFFTVLLGGAWFITTQATRYLLPVLPFWYIAIGAGTPFFIEGLKKLKMARIIPLGVLGLAAGLLFIDIYHYRHQYPVLAGLVTREQYLRKMERSYPAAKWSGEHLPADARVFNVEEIRQFYFERPMVREEFLHFFTSYTNSRSPDEILEFLRKKGFTHLMVTESDREGRPDRLSWINAIVNDPSSVEFLIEIPSENLRDERLIYYFYKIR